MLIPRLDAAVVRFLKKLLFSAQFPQSGGSSISNHIVPYLILLEERNE